MKWLLVDKYDNIVTSVDLASNVGLTGAKTYFKGVKKMSDDDKFDKLWRVMSESDYDTQFKNNLQNRQMGKMKYQWWKDEPTGPDDEFDY